MTLAELPHPIYTCVFCIALHFGSNYLGSRNQHRCLWKSTQLQVFLVIRGGYVPDKSQTVNTKTSDKGFFRLKLAIFPRYSRFLGRRIVILNREYQDSK